MAALAALLSSALWGTSDFLGGTLSRRVQPLAVVGFAQAIVLPAVIAVVFGLGAEHDPSGWLPWGVLTGLLSLVAVVAFYEALATGTMGVVAPIASVGVVVPVAIGLARGERPATVQLAGMVVAVAGIVLASGPELRGVGRHTARGGGRPLLLAGVAALGFGSTLWSNARGSHYSVGMTLLSSRVTIVVVAGALGLVWHATGGVTRGDLATLAAIGAFEAGANSTYALATRRGLISVVAVFASLYPVVTLLFARFVLDERLRRIQVVGVTCAMAGVVMLAAG